jgi:hypothetical protein
MPVSRHHELDVTNTEIEGAMDFHDCTLEEAVAILIGDPSDEEKSLFNGNSSLFEGCTPARADRMIRTIRLARYRWRGKALGNLDHVL